MVCSTRENLTLHCLAIEREVFSRGTGYKSCIQLQQEEEKEYMYVHSWKISQYKLDYVLHKIPRLFRKSSIHLQIMGEEMQLCCATVFSS